MANNLDEQRLQALVMELAKGAKTEQAVADLSRTVLKMSVERVMATEMEAHQGYSPHEAKSRNSGNSLNVYATGLIQNEAVVPNARCAGPDGG